MELDKIPQWMLALEEEDAAFLKNFLMKSGSLKDIAKLYGVSYPTVRLRLDKLIQNLKDQGYTFVPLSELIYRDHYHLDHEGRQIKD